jgi:MFS family permease
LAAGAVFTSLAVTYLIASLRATALARRHGSNVITVAALTIVAGHVVLIGTLIAIGTTGPVIALLPGLMLVGAGMGLGIAPLATNLLATLRPAQAGAASGALSTAQYVGSTLGVALVGITFFGGLHAGYAPALERGLSVLVVALALVAALSRLLPAPATPGAR